MAPIDRARARDLIVRYEGRSSSVYTNTRGDPAVGIGFNLEWAIAEAVIGSLGLDVQAILNGEQHVTSEQIDLLFGRSLDEAVQRAESVVPGFANMSAQRQLVIIDVLFNLSQTDYAEYERRVAKVDRAHMRVRATQTSPSEWFDRSVSDDR